MKKEKVHTPIESICQLQALAREQQLIEYCAFQNIDFTLASKQILSCDYHECMFLGCTLPAELKQKIGEDNLVFPSIKVPYNVFRSQLYSPYSLYAGYRPGEPQSYKESFDSKIYEHYLKLGKRTTNIQETLARSLHDHAISDAMHDFLSLYDERQIVGIMGGHSLSRTDEMYRKIVYISKTLAEEDFLLVSGGGPGAMEATHLGAWMAGRTNEEVADALCTLSIAPNYQHPEWLDSAFQVMKKYPQEKYVSLGVPTWLYGHEPATPFATHIAKYFENSIREDGILTIAMGGIIYSPGSAGTMQEIFQDAVQNHYLSFGYASPMIFLGKEYWNDEMPVYPLLQHLMKKGKYKNLLLTISNSQTEIVETIKAFKDKNQ